MSVVITKHLLSKWVPLIHLSGWLACCFLSPHLAAEKAKSISYSATSLEPLLILESPVKGFHPVSFRESLQANRKPTDLEFLKNRDLSAAEAKFEYFSKNFSHSDESPTHFSIPPIIHLIWLGSPPTERVEIAVASWRKHHPGFEIRLWTDKEMESFVWSFPRSEEIFREGLNWAEKSDILRFEILYQFGGIYSDTDVICLKSFQDLMTNGLSFFACIEENFKNGGFVLLGSAFIGAAKNSTIIKKAIDYTQTIKEAPLTYQAHRSGPGPITKASYEALDEGVESVLILPCSYFYPLPAGKKKITPYEMVRYIRPESFAIHFWEYTWFSDKAVPWKG